MPGPSPRERMRDFLSENGPARPAEVAAACDVPLSAVMAEIDGAFSRRGTRADRPVRGLRRPRARQRALRALPGLILGLRS